MNDFIIDRVIWIALSVGIAILSGVVLAYMKQHDQRVTSENTWRSIFRNDWLINILRLLYAVSLPAIALFTQGVLSYRGLGIKFLPWTATVRPNDNMWVVWQHDIESTIVVIILTWLVLTFGLRAVSSRITHQWSKVAAITVSAIRESIIDQVHWSFYRELCIYIWGIANGSWIVVLPLSIELLLNPATWSNINNEVQVTKRIITCGIFLASTILFIQTQNLWVMVVMEIVLRVIFARYLIDKDLDQQTLD